MAWFRMVLAALACLPLAAAGQPFPSKPVRMIVPYAPGGAGDTIARTVSVKLTEALAQPIVVENRTGASGVIAADFVAKSPPDGYTLLLHLGPPHQTIQFFQKGVPYDPIKDFTPIMVVGTAPQTVVVGPALPEVKSLAELIAHARKNPGKLSYGTSGVGSSQHLGGLLLNSATGIDLAHVPYKGGAAALNDVLGGQIPIGIVVLSNVMPHLKSGKLRALAVLEAQRATSGPGIPTVAEAGVPGYAIPATWAGVLAPAGMAAPLVAQLHGSLAKAVASPDVRLRLEAAGFEVGGGSPQDFGRMLTQSVELYRRITSQAGIQPE